MTGDPLSQPSQPSLDELLEASSRTFALTIPFLPEPERAQVTVAYLLFRIADTLEDAAEWSGERRAAGLRRFEALLRDSGATAGDALEGARCFAAQILLEPPTAHAGYLSLLRASPSVFAALSALPAAARAAIVAHTARTASGMADLCARLPEDGSLKLRSLAELRGYCYLVAGIVGELLTELFLLARPRLAGASAALRADALLYTIVVRAVKTEGGRNTAGEHALETIADSTGGATYFPDTIAQLGEMFDRIDRELRTQYRIAYYPDPRPPAGTFRNLEVRVKCECKVRSRKAYYSGGRLE